MRLPNATGFEWLTLAAEAFGIAILALTVWYAAGSFRLQVQGQELGVVLELLDQYNMEYEDDFSRMEAIALWHEHSQRPVAQLFARDTLAWSAAIRVLNFLEKLGLALTSGYADEGAACSSFRQVANRYYMTLRGWLILMRKSGHTGWDEQTLVVIDSLSHRWKNGCPREGWALRLGWRPPLGARLSALRR